MFYLSASCLASLAILDIFWLSSPNFLAWSLARFRASLPWLLRSFRACCKEFDYKTPHGYFQINHFLCSTIGQLYLTLRDSLAFSITWWAFSKFWLAFTPWVLATSIFSSDSLTNSVTSSSLSFNVFSRSLFRSWGFFCSLWFSNFFTTVFLS